MLTIPGRFVSEIPTLAFVDKCQYESEFEIFLADYDRGADLEYFFLR